MYLVVRIFAVWSMYVEITFTEHCIRQTTWGSVKPSRYEIYWIVRASLYLLTDPFLDASLSR